MPLSDADPRALDRAVAEAMGAIIHDTDYGHIFIWPKGLEHIGDQLPPFSADTPEGWAAMRLVVDHMAKKYHWRLQSPFQAGGQWFAGLTPLGCTGWNGRPDCEASGATLPEAVARAALAALEATDADR